MAADSYIQGALNELQNALNDIQQQIHDLQRRTDQQRQRLQQDLSSLESTRRHDEVAMTRMADDMQKHLIYDQLQHVHHQEDDKKVRLGQLDHELAPLLQRKTQIYRELQNLYQQLSQYMASPDIR